MNKFIVSKDPVEVQSIGKMIGENLKRFNESKVGPYTFQNFIIAITDDVGNILGGVKGEIFERICMVHNAWVQEKERKKNLGTTIFKKVEEFAKQNNCKIIQLDTAEFQAKGFYEKIGFTVVAILPENFKGYTTYILRKMI